MNLTISRETLLVGSLLLAVTHCSTQPQVRTAAKSARNGGGESCDRAVIIDAPKESEGIAAEYEWLARNYPGYKRLGQSLGACRGFRSDFVEIETATGEKRTIVFNIDRFFGKW